MRKITHRSRKDAQRRKWARLKNEGIYRSPCAPRSLKPRTQRPPVPADVKLAKVLARPVASLGLTHAAIRVLKNHQDVEIIGDLVQYSAAELAEVPGIGSKTIDKIVTGLKGFNVEGLALKPNQGPTRRRPVAA